VHIVIVEIRQVLISTRAGESQLSVAAPFPDAPILSSDEGLFISSSQGRTGSLYRLAWRTGRIKWKVNYHTGFHTPSVDAHDVVYNVVSGKLLAINGASGKTIWSSNLGFRLPAVCSKSTPVIAPDGTIVVADENRIVAIKKIRKVLRLSTNKNRAGVNLLPD